MSEFSEITEGTEKGLPIEALRVSDKLTITAVPLKRREGLTEAQKEAMAEVIKESDGVIFEYFPKEITRCVSNPFFGHYRTDYECVMEFFTPLADQARNHKKPVYVFDPLYDEKFAVLFHGFPEVISDLGLSATYLLTMSGIVRLYSKLINWKSENDREPEKKEEPQENGKKESRGRKFTRRQFLGISLGAAATLASTKYVRDTSLEGITGTPSPSRFPNERKFRRAIIAKGISQIGRNLDRNPSERPRNLVLLYSPLQWKGIRRLLEDRKKLEEEFKFYSLLKQGRLKDDFFTARKYEWTGEEWSLEKAEIGGSPGPTV